MKKIELRKNKLPKLSRRSVLAGGGTLMALPLLEAMLPSQKMAFAQDATPPRLITVFTGNGMNMDTWTPANAGRDFDLSATLEPLAPFKDKTLVLSGLQNSPARPAIHGHHGAASGAFLTCTRVRQSIDDVRAAISMDQEIGGSQHGSTPFPTLDISADSGSGVGGHCDNGYSCLYLRNISWSDATTPVHTEHDPNKVFYRLFRDKTLFPEFTQNNRPPNYHRSVIDGVLGDANRLRSQLGAADNLKLQKYLSGIRELELRLEGFQKYFNLPEHEAPEMEPESYFERGRILVDLMVKAFESDLTRVGTYMLSKGLSSRKYTHLGLTTHYHSLATSAGAGVLSARDKISKIDKFNMEEVAHICSRLSDSVDVTGKSLLDSTVVYRSSSMGDLKLHSSKNLPVVLIGSCNGYFDVGQHIHYTNAPELGELYLSIMDAMGVPRRRFGISANRLAQVSKRV